MLELRQLRYAITTADQRSFARAALTFNMKQSTLSQRVTRLEDQLGFKLFERTTRGARPTEASKPFLDAARRIIRDIDELQNRARAIGNGSEGRLAIGCTSSLLTGITGKLVREFMERCPNVQFDGFEQDCDDLFRGLQNKKLDLVIAPACLKRPDFQMQPVWSEPISVCFGDDFPLRSLERIQWSDLRDEPFVFPASGVGPVLKELLLLNVAELGCSPSATFQETGMESVLGLVSLGRHITLVTAAAKALPIRELQMREVWSRMGAARLDFAAFWVEENDNPVLSEFRDILSGFRD